MSPIHLFIYFMVNPIVRTLVEIKQVTLTKQLYFHNLRRETFYTGPNN